AYCGDVIVRGGNAEFFFALEESPDRLENPADAHLYGVAVADERGGELADDLQGAALLLGGRRGARAERLGFLDEVVDLRHVNPVVTVGADESRIDLGDEELGLSGHFLVVPHA